MADTAVRVDIIVGQNTVIPAVDATTASLTRASRTASTLNGGFDSLSKQGLKRLEGGFQALAFQAAGVPGPLGRIASGLVLLGAGSGPLLAVAAAAGTLAVIWKKFGAVSDEATDAIERMNKELHKQEQALLDIAAADAEVARQRKRAGFFAFFAEGGTSGILGMIAKHFSDIADEIERTADAYAQLSSHGATDDWLTNFWKTHPMPKAGKKAAPVRQPDPAQDWWLNQEFTQGSVVRNLKEQMAGLNAELINTPGLLDQIGVALEALVVPFDEIAQAWEEFTQQLRYALFDGMVTLAQGLGQVLAGEGNFGKVILQAFGNLLTQMGVALMAFGATMLKLLPALANPFTSGAAALIAGAALVAIGATLSAIATKQGNSASPRAATGGVNSGQLRQDAGAVATKGTVTVLIPRDGLIRPSDPVWQEFMVSTFNEAKGRNLTFKVA